MYFDCGRDGVHCTQREVAGTEWWPLHEESAPVGRFGYGLSGLALALQVAALADFQFVAGMMV